MKENILIQPCRMEHLDEYGRIYAAAFSGEPWNDLWKPAGLPFAKYRDNAARASENEP